MMYLASLDRRPAMSEVRQYQAEHRAGEHTDGVHSGAPGSCSTRMNPVNVSISISHTTTSFEMAFASAIVPIFSICIYFCKRYLAKFLRTEIVNQ